jgi:hypothetical protein
VSEREARIVSMQDTPRKRYSGVILQKRDLSGFSLRARPIRPS